MSRKFGYVALLFLVVAAFVWNAPALRAEEGDGNGPVLMFLNLSGQFDTDTTGWTWDTTSEEWVCDCTCECYCGDGPEGSPVLLVPIGTLAINGGDQIGDARFIPDAMPPDFNYDDTSQQFMIAGAFDTAGPNTVHLTTPGGGFIPPAVQEAFFNASNAVIDDEEDPPVIGFAALGDLATTVEIAMFIYEHGGPGGIGSAIGTTPPEIMTYLFNPQQAPSSPPGAPPPPPANPELECNSPCMAEGELFAHDGDDVPEFAYDMAFETTNFKNSFVIDVCLLVEVEVNQQSVNLKKKGSLPVTIYASATFDTDDIDEDTIEIGGVMPTKVNFAKNKAICHFSVPALIAAGVLVDSSTTEVTLRADLFDGSCIKGTSAINVK